MPTWQYDRTTHRYRNADTGKSLGPAQESRLRDRLVDAAAEQMRGHADDLAGGKIDTGGWLTRMRAAVKTLTVAQFMFGRGGKGSMDKRAYGQAGALVKAQYTYLADFARQIDAGALTDAQVRARVGLYAASSTAAHGRGQGASWGITLGRVPGDGKTSCKANCRCRLDITQTRTAVRVKWIVEPSAEHCDDCTRLAAEWSPKVFPKGG